MHLNVFQRHVTDAAGNVLPGASVAVRDANTAHLVQLYEDYDGDTAIGNPIEADEDGFVRFYVRMGRYQITATLDDISRVWEDEVLGLDGDRVYRRSDPRRYGAEGDGEADDRTAFAAAEAAAPTIHLETGVNYNLEDTKPIRLVNGSGSITLTGSSASPTVSGFEVGFDAAGGSIVAQPPVWAELANGLTASPGGISNYFNVVLAPGSNAASIETGKNVWRSVVIGEAALQNAIQIERCEIVGSGCMRFAELAERTTAMGTIALSWVGTSGATKAEAQQKLIDRKHDFWLSDTPGSATWNFAGLNTRNEGVGDAIDAFSAYPTSTNTQSQNVAIGRDAGLHLVRGDANTMVGYQSGAHFFHALENTAIGRLALRDGVFIQGCTALGQNAGIHNQEGIRNIFIGRQAGENFVKGSRNLFIGGSSGQDHTLNGTREYSNKFILEFFQNGRYLQGDTLIGSLFLNLNSTALEDIEGLGSGFYNVPSAALAPTTAGRFLGTATSSISTFNSRADNTASRTHATFQNPNGVVGTIATSASATAYNTSSDARDKIAIDGSPDSLSKINALQVHLARFKTEDEGEERAMVFAQEAEDITPYAVTAPTETNDRYQMDYSKLVPDLIAAVQAQSAEIAALRQEVAELKAAVVEE